MLFVFLDTETSGLNPAKHRTLEIAFQIIDAATAERIVSYESIVFQPQAVFAEADPMSLQINGFSWELVLKGKSEKAVAADILEILEHAQLHKVGGAFVCQNPSFDRAFFSQMIDVDLQDNAGLPYHWLDLASMYWAARVLAEKRGSPLDTEEGLSKDSIATYLGLPKEASPHRAMQGVNHLIACYESLLRDHKR